jgi:HD-GYP domain-containing protein (c-di-GMP phosphodiesterase class II)
MNKERTKVILCEGQENISNSIIFMLNSQYNIDVIELSDPRQIIETMKAESISMIIVSAVSKIKDAETFFELFIDSGFDQVPFIYLSAQSAGKIWPPYKKKVPTAIINRDACLKKLQSIIQSNFKQKEELDPPPYTSILFKTLSYFSSIKEEIYIQLPSSRFLKIYNEGDKVTLEDVERYKKKSINFLFIKKEAYNWILQELQEAIPVMAKDPDFKPDLERTAPLISDVVDLEKEFLVSVHKKMGSVVSKMKKNKQLGSFLKKVSIDRTSGKYVKNRSGLVCNIACAIAKDLDWATEATFDKIVYIAHIHDLVLFGNLKLLKIENLANIEIAELQGETFTEEEIKLIESHVDIVADIVDNDPEAPMDAAEIIRQHHERPDATGFKKYKISKIQPYAALMSISINFSQYILENPNWTFSKYLEGHKDTFRGGPFTKIMQALANIAKRK